MQQKIMSCFLTFAISTSTFAATTSIESDYCVQAGGKVELMAAHYGTRHGVEIGDSKPFCTFHIDNGFIVVGLSTFASEKPSIAATLIKTFPKFDMENSPLFHGPYANPSLNFCKNIGGSSISFFFSSGGFTNELGESDVCVFGDGSMVSGWSLIYIANERTGYNVIREKINSIPLEFDSKHNFRS